MGITYCFLLRCLTLNDFATETFMIYCSWSLWLICMLVRCCLLIGIDKMRIKWNTILFESEVQFVLKFSGRTKFWWIYINVNICQVNLGVANSWDQRVDVKKTKKFCLMLYLIFSCQGSPYLSCDHLWSHSFNFLPMFKVLIWMLQFTLWLYFWYPCFKSVPQRMW